MPPAVLVVSRRDELRALVEGYVDDVLAGRRVVGKLERLAVERHARDLAAVTAGERADLRFDEGRAFFAMEFAEAFIRHTKGKAAGLRFRFDEKAGGAKTSDTGWMAFLVWAIFGWMRKHSEGHWVRRYDEAYVSVGRGNAKTFIAAIIALIFYVGMGEAAPEAYFAATQREQAARGWRQAAGFVKKSPELSGIMSVHKSRYEILREDDFEASFRALSRNDDEFDGFAPFFVSLDEFHAHPDSGAYDVLRSGLGKRNDGLMLITTTAGANAESVCASHEKVMAQILQGVATEDTTFIYIARIDETDDPGDELAWRKANPNLGVSVDLDKLRAEWKRAQNDPQKKTEFLRKRCNTWTAGHHAWMSLETWDACDGRFLPGDHLRALCYIGVDLSKTNDYTAAVAAFPRDGGEFGLDAQFWLPEPTLVERRKTDKVPVVSWQEQGLVVATPGVVIDQEFVKAWLIDMNARFDVREIAFDPAQSWKLVAELEALGLPAVHFPQSWASMHGATKEVQDLILLRKVLHSGNPVLRWMFTNVAIRQNATGLMRPDKAKSTDRIDGITAMIMALGRALTHTQGAVPTVWSFGA